MGVLTVQHATNLTCSIRASATYTPSFAYPGGKARLAKTLVSYFPKTGKTFVDVFAGRGNVFFAAASTLDYANWRINDIRTSTFFQAMLQHGHSVEIPECTRENFDRLESDRNSVEAILNEPRLSYSGGGWDAGFGRDHPHLISVAGYRKKLVFGQRVLAERKPRITALDYREVLRELGPDDFAYLDPPYKNAKVHAYSATDLNHEEMVDILLGARFRWALSEYPDPLYCEGFGAPIWRQERSCSMSVNRATERRTECLWVNRPVSKSQ